VEEFLAGTEEHFGGDEQVDAKQVARAARAMAMRSVEEIEPPFRDTRDAGRQLAAQLAPYAERPTSSCSHSVFQRRKERINGPLRHVWG
jgi:hypothetical protein